MYVTVDLPRKYHDDIVRFRREICREIRINARGANISPIPYATYVYAFDDDGGPPIAMAELFRYDQAYAAYSEAPFSEATDLSELAPMNELAHIRSMYTDSEKRRTRLFGHLCVGLAHAAHHMGARLATAGTAVVNRRIIGLHRTAQMEPLGIYVLDGTPQQLSLLDMEAIYQRAKNIRNLNFLRFDASTMQQLRRRQPQGLCAA